MFSRRLRVLHPLQCFVLRRFYAAAAFCRGTAHGAASYVAQLCTSFSAPICFRGLQKTVAAACRRERVREKKKRNSTVDADKVKVYIHRSKCYISLRFMFDEKWPCSDDAADLLFLVLSTQGCARK